MISIALATHNEEKNLSMCLDSVKSFADEIVIADGESSDRTVEIAKKYGAKIISTTNKANFHINKQIAMDATHGEVVLQLDADEVVDDELKQFITELHHRVMNEKYPSDTNQPVAWWIKRKNFFFGRFLKKGGQYPDPVIRLYLKGQAQLPQRDVHEQMIVKGEVGWAGGHLLHYSNPTFEDYLRKFNTYTSFKAHQLYENHVPISVGSFFQYTFWKPMTTFLSLYIRHRGYVDGRAGFLFALFSGYHHRVAYLKLWEMYDLQKQQMEKA